jgi:SAM-dependent methyltransferase
MSTGPSYASPLRQRLRRLLRPALLGTLRSTVPRSDVWGFDRGTPVDRFYIERFLRAHAVDIRGRTLEVMDDAYTRRFGTAVARADVLDIDAGNPRATVVVPDLAAADAIPDDAFDCFVLTQTLQLVFDVRAALGHVHRVLRPGGTLLLTVPCVSRIVDHLWRDTDYWRFTPASLGRLVREAFGPDAEVEVRGHGNVLACVAFMAGIAHEELPRRRLERDDDRFPLVVTARAVKAGGAPR